MTADERNYLKITERRISQIGSNTKESVLLALEQDIEYAPPAIKEQLWKTYGIRMRLLNQAEAAQSAVRAGYTPVMSAREARNKFKNYHKA